VVSRLGPPPAELPADPPQRRWAQWEPLVRIYHEHPGRDGIAPRTVGPVARFDPHVRDRRQHPREDPEGRGVRYLARDLNTGLAEAYPEQRPEVAICAHARAAWVRPVDDVALLDLTGEGAMAIGAVGTLAWGDEPRRLTQRWGRRIYEQYRHLDGIYYRAAHQGGESVALWERAPEIERAAGGDRALWAVWTRVVVALSGQGRRPRRIAAAGCALCRECGFAG
jgi:RES domain-containing protein